MAKAVKKGKGKSVEAVVELNDQAEVAEANVFEDPSAALEKGSAANLAVLQGNEVVGPEEMEGIDVEYARKKLEEVDRLFKLVDETYWHLSAEIAEVNNKKLYKIFGHKTFEEYINKFGKDRRTGYYLVQVFNYFNHELRTILAEKPEDYQYVTDKAKTFGWTKAMKLATNRIITPDNARDVADKAEMFSVKELDMFCKAVDADKTEEQKEDDVDNNDLKTVRTTFQLYLHQHKVVEEAVTKALSMMKQGATKSGAIAMVCQEFLATHVTSQGRDSGVAESCAQLERNLGLSVVAIDEDVGKIVYGEKYLAKLAGDEPTDDFVVSEESDGVEAAQ